MFRHLIYNIYILKIGILNLQGCKCNPFFPTKSITRRKGEGNFKLDTSIKINNECVKNGYSIIIKENNINEIGKFINKMII